MRVFGGLIIALLLIALVGAYSTMFTVYQTRQALVVRFGAFDRYAGPGLNYHLPYPIETVLTPQVTVVRQIHFGMRQVEDLRRGTTIRDVP